MCYKMLSHCESLVAMAAMIWSISSIGSLMSYKIIIVRESLFILAAFVWFIPTVSSLMIYKSTLLCESLFTLPNYFSGQNFNHIGCIDDFDVVSPQCVSSGELSDYLFGCSSNFSSI